MLGFRETLPQAIGSRPVSTLSVEHRYPLRMRAVLRHSIDTCRDVHGHHPDQTASENLQGRMAMRRAVEVIPDNEQQYPRNKDFDHVDVKP
jgi:hypothetical protein